MAIFDNVAFLEGEQAEEYKRKKAEKEERDEKERNNRIDNRGGYITVDSKIEKGKQIDTEPYRKKNGIHKTYGWSGKTPNGETKHIDARRSGSTNKKITTTDNKKIHYWDDENPDGAYRTFDKYKNYEETKDDKRRDKYADKAAKRATKDIEDGDEKWRQRELARDAANRNMRRHPEKWNKSRHESALFESVRFLND